MNIIFTLVFNVEVRRGDYRSFIEDLRNRLAGDRVSHGRPVLPPQPLPDETTPTEWFEIVLRTTNPDPHEIRLLFRSRNVYLDAYRMENSATWLELSRPPPPGSPPPEHLIPGSTFLAFDGGYDGTHGLEATAGRGRAETPLGRDYLRDAVKLLATSTDRTDRARSLLVVIQMISESVRFEDISNFLFNNYIEGRGDVPNGRLLQLENSWRRLSNALLRSDAHAEPSIFPIIYYDQGNRFMFTAEQAVAAIGILLFNVKGINRHRRINRQLAHPYPNDSVDVSDGQPLVEVFAVQINNIDGEDPGDLYGTVKVTDGEICQYIYNREREKTESIKPGENAILTGPAVGSISASDSFTIDVALMDRDSFPDVSPDDEVSKGQISWNVYDTNNIYDEPLYEKINGRNGSATVVYGVFSDAVRATIEVTLINGDGESPADVYGLLVTSNSKFTGNYESVLFWVTKESGVSVEVRPGELIPLSRSIIAVPLNSDLRVRAHLYDRDSLPDISPDDEIANGTASFPAQFSGTLQQNISGKCGEIQVNVTWTP